MVRVEIVDGPIPAAEPPGLEGGRAGAVVEFRGIVRATEDGRPIRAIDYECHREMARHQLERIAAEMVDGYGLIDLIVIHRAGPVPVGVASLYLLASAPHREAAFAASVELIRRLKADVPIWKHPIEG